MGSPLVSRWSSSAAPPGNGRQLFTGDGDGPPHQNTVSYWWRKTLRDAELSGNKLHDLLMPLI